MFKFIRQIAALAAISLTTTSCMYQNCDEDCSLGHGEATCMSHPDTECKCNETFRVKKKK